MTRNDITIKIYKDTHKLLQESHAREIGRRGEVFPFIEWVDILIKTSILNHMAID